MPPKKGKGRGRGRGRDPSPPPTSQGRPAPTSQGHPPPISQARPPPPTSETRTASASQGKKSKTTTASVEAVETGIPERTLASQKQTMESDSTSQSSRDSASQIMEKVAGLSIKPKPYEAPKKKVSPIKRPGYGTAGRKIALLANYFVLKFQDVSVYHYDVDIVDGPKDKKKGKSVVLEGRTAKEDMQKKVGHVEHQQKRNMGKAKCREIVSEMVKSKALQKYNPVYDGQKNIFTNQPLPFKEKTSIDVEMEVEGRKKNYIIVIQPVQKIDGSNIISLEPLRELYRGRSTEIPQEVLLVYDTVMNHRDPPLTQVHIRNSFFTLNPKGACQLGSGLEIWFGYSQSVRLAEEGPVLVVNLAAKAFHRAGSVIDYACDVLNTDITKSPKLEPRSIFEIEKALKGVRVKVTHQKQPRKYKVKGVSKVSARELTFDSGSKKISVEQYFRENYKYQLKYPYLPCLHMQTSNPSTYIPMETCEVVEGQVKLGKLSGDLTSKMIRQTAVPPRERFDSIVNDGQAINRTSRNKMVAFGLIMDVNLMKVDGRIISAPALEYGGEGNSRIARPDNRGVWRIEDGKQFYKVKKVNAWILMSFASDRFCGMDKLRRYADCLVSSSRKCGMSCGPPVDIKIFDRRTKTDEALQYAKKKNADFAIVVLSRRDTYHTYEEVKFLADFKYGLVTQCMEDKTLGRINDQITTNVCLKINVKLGGINHRFLQRPQVFARPVIIFGADAIHWPRGFGYPSIAAVVGSLDPTASRYALTCCLQDQEKDKLSQEIIKNMKNIVKGILEHFRAVNNGLRPEKIIFYRDGVSEGQFVTVIEQEVSSIQAACQELYERYLPITYIVVQKRHQTRLRPRDPREGAGKCGNVPPGTTVDTTITHPVFFDFFVCSHEGIQGTSKPAHYTVLHDDNKFGPDELQQLSYFLCHTYVRCTRSVSLPAPILYADLAAARAKKYADLFTQDDSMSSSGGSEPKNRPLPPEVVRAIENMKSFENNMFYV
ncbi:protein argonaute-4-like [Uloborus diversus]|uniref:protein argonaute-4-like n=1 Tax=Uloborus diversus TaxID=327109 RepID=UPI0024095BCE|nr:protein argonaute-4-like [Uloborus diversus]